jgi:hypothetical protein
MFSCFRNCFDNFGLVTAQHEPKKEENFIALDTNNMGNYLQHF